MMRVAWYTALVLTTLTILVVLWQFSIAVVMFLLSLAIAAAFRPLVERLTSRGLRKEFALVISFGLVFSTLIALFLAAAGPLVADFQQATNDGLFAYEQVKNRWLYVDNPLLNNLAKQLPPPAALYTALTGSESSAAIQAVFGAAENTFQFLARMAMVIILSLYWSADQVRFERLWLSLLPVESRARARKIWHALETGVGTYLGRETVLSLLGGVCLWLGYLILGVHYATLVALIGALARLIPWLGLALVVLLPVLVGSTLGWWGGLAAAAFTLLTLILLETTLGRKLFLRQRYSSFLLVIIVIALAKSYGLLGAALAPILAVALQILFSHLLKTPSSSAQEAFPDTLANLQEKMTQINILAAQLNDPHETETTNLVARLERLVEKTIAAQQQ